MPQMERQPKRESRKRTQPDEQLAESPAESETRESKLERAVYQLLTALDGCAGDPPDCPHCGPARAFAQELLSPESAQKNPANAEQERVTFSGRAGSNPTLRTTPKGTLIARFPLAVHGPGNTTTWFPVLAFNQRAEGLKEIVSRGAALDVIGYLHSRETRSRDGSTRTIQEIYAVTVTSPQAK